MSNTINQYPELAIALQYDGINAPKITAKGTQNIAKKILETAAEFGIPLEQDAELAGILSQIPLGDEIPENLYKAIAEVIAFAYFISNRTPPGFKDFS